MHADEDGEYRLSLAGAQDKLPVVLRDDGRIGLTKGRTPSTHILKTPIEWLEHTIANEALCLAIGQELGIEAVTAAPRRVLGREYLLIERYGRRVDDRPMRLHQEDFCQALGISTERKYQAEGGPSLAGCFALLRRGRRAGPRDHQAPRHRRAQLPGRQPRRPRQELLAPLSARGARRGAGPGLRRPQHRRPTTGRTTSRARWR
jgi:hypothetical protein